MPAAPSAAAQALKALRLQYSVDLKALANAIGGKNVSSWQHYEDRFKRDLLPLHIAQKVAPVFASYGCDPARIFALAGASPHGAAIAAPAAKPLLQELQEIEETIAGLERRLAALRVQLGRR